MWWLCPPVEPRFHPLPPNLPSSSLKDVNMHFVFAVIIKMIMMFSPSISWAPSDKISLAFVESGRGAVSSKRLTWFLDLLRWESSGHCVFSPCSTDTVPFSCRVGNPNSQACVWPSIQFCLMCLQTSERERGKKSPPCCWEVWIPD